MSGTDQGGGGKGKHKDPRWRVAEGAGIALVVSIAGTAIGNNVGELSLREAIAYIGLPLLAIGLMFLTVRAVNAAYRSYQALREWKTEVDAFFEREYRTREFMVNKFDSMTAQIDILSNEVELLKVNDQLDRMSSAEGIDTRWQTLERAVHSLGWPVRREEGHFALVTTPRAGRMRLDLRNREDMRKLLFEMDAATDPHLNTGKDPGHR